MTEIMVNAKLAKRKGRAKMTKGLRKGVELRQPKCRKRKVEPLTEEERELVANHLDVANFAAFMAMSGTRGYTGCYNYEDLKAVAHYALCVAAKDFDPSRGYTFRTYASRKAQGYIQHALRDTSRMVKVPRSVFKYRDQVRQLMQQGLGMYEIAEELGIQPKQVVECEKSWGQIHLSFDSATENEDEWGFEPPSYDPDEADLIGRSILLELGRLPEEVVEMLNEYHYGDSSNFSEWEIQFCRTFFELYRNKVHQGLVPGGK